MRSMLSCSCERLGIASRARAVARGVGRRRTLPAAAASHSRLRRSRARTRPRAALTGRARSCCTSKACNWRGLFCLSFHFKSARKLHLARLLAG
eukprot:6184477-Pleurochrysis_carterae.AAC.2